MKDKVGFIIPVVLMLFGAYALVVTLGSGGEESVALLRDHQIPRGLALMFGLIGIGGGVVVLMTMLSNKKSAHRSVTEER
jgi:hypothetical protein